MKTMLNADLDISLNVNMIPTFLIGSSIYYDKVGRVCFQHQTYTKHDKSCLYFSIIVPESRAEKKVLADREKNTEKIQNLLVGLTYFG